MYPNYYQFQNNYQQPMATIYGKVIQTVDQISPSEIPMDGNIAVFPKNDLSEIYVKRWMSNGSISTVRYVPNFDNGLNAVIPSPNVTEPPKTANIVDADGIMARLDELNKKLDDVISTKSASAKPRKEVATNE